MLIGLGSLNDNSFLTHLATGRLILDGGAVPKHDPYSFTAAGEPWVIQSWLASVVYASAERLGGLDLVRLVTGLLAGALTAVSWRILRPVEGLVAKLAAAALFLAVAAGSWAERPFMFGLLAFALTVLAAEGGLDPRWLVPLGWLWVNTHGSFPLGLVYLAVVWLGSRLDGSDGRREARALLWAALGVVVGVVSPLGVRLLTFPVDLLGRQELLANVLEWQAPAFTSISERAFLLQVVAAIVLIVRRPAYRRSLVVAVFAAAALLGSRNVGVASIALLPAMVPGLQHVGSLTVTVRRSAAVPLCALLAAALVVAGWQERTIDLRAYPVDALAYLEEQRIDLREHHMAAPELVGNLLTFLYGPEGRRVFYDDRFDMYPAAVSEAQLALVKAEPGVFAALERYGIELVVVRLTDPMARTFSSDPGWRVLFTDERWQLSCRRDVELGRAFGRC